jgi:hypothetical protein
VGSQTSDTHAKFAGAGHSKVTARQVRGHAK